MSWRSIDFRGIIDLDRKIIDQFENYLEQKENRLSQQITSLIPTTYDTSSPVLPNLHPLKLSEAVEIFSKQVRSAIQTEYDDEKHSPRQVEKIENDLNKNLWGYVEMLESSATELYEQVKQVPINKWHEGIAEVVQHLKDIFSHRIEDLMWAIRRLENPLKSYCQQFQSKNQKQKRNWSFFGNNYLDRNLLRNLQQTEKYLKNQQLAFTRRYQDFLSLNIKTEEYLDEMKGFPVLALLEVADQNLYVDVFRLLKMLELDKRSKKEVMAETTQALKQLAGIDTITDVFDVYLAELEEAFFNSSLEWKSFDRREENYIEAYMRLQSKVFNYQRELKELLKTMSRYRLFVLKNDPNPYVRSRWGFSEWIVGPEPKKSKKILEMIYSAEELNGYFSQFLKSLSQDPYEQYQKEFESQQEIDNLLHEMGQPLISHAMMRDRAEKLLDRLKEYDEVGSSELSTISYFENVLAKAMREDWKYQVLFDFPLFHQIYRTHEALSEHFDDIAHVTRLDNFFEIFDQIEGWVEERDLFSHTNGIEEDMNDLKSYLQDFLATVQRAEKDKSNDPFLDETIHKFSKQLLEYRYVFGQFFSTIMKKNKEGVQLRNQFLFVDQYFETVENLLNDLKLAWQKRNP